MPTWNVAAAQYAPRPNDVDANVLHHLKFIAAAAQENTEVLLFPEYSLTGFIHEGATLLCADSPRLEPLALAAQRYQMTIIAGLPVATPQGLISAGVIFLPDGSRRLCLQSHNPDVDEMNGIPVLTDKVIGHASKRITLAVDSPNHQDAPSASSASLYMCGRFISEVSWQAEVVNMQFCAFENHIAVLQVNSAAAPGNQTAVGRSACWDEKGQLVVRAEAGELLVVARRQHNGWHGEVIPLR